MLIGMHYGSLNQPGHQDVRLGPASSIGEETYTLPFCHGGRIRVRIRLLVTFLGYKGKKGRGHEACTRETRYVDKRYEKRTLLTMPKDRRVTWSG